MHIEKEIAEQFYQNFGLVSYETINFLEGDEIKKLEQERDQAFNQEGYEVPDVVLYSFWKTIENSNGFSKMSFFDSATQEKIFKFMGTEDLQEYWINSEGVCPVLLLCNGMFSYNDEQTLENAIRTTDQLISDNDLDKFCIFYSIAKDLKRKEKIEKVICKQNDCLSMLEHLGIECWDREVEMISALSV